MIVHEGEGRGNDRRQRIDIYLNFIGAFEVPDYIITPSEVEEHRRLQEEQEAEERRLAHNREWQKEWREKRNSKFLPEQIPAHYGLNNQATRWGSKYEMLIVPIVTVMLGYFFRGIAKVVAKHEENGNNNENFCIVAGIVTLIIFNAMTGYALYTSFNKIENLSLNACESTSIFLCKSFNVLRI